MTLLHKYFALQSLINELATNDPGSLPKGTECVFGGSRQWFACP